MEYQGQVHGRDIIELLKKYMITSVEFGKTPLNQQKLMRKMEEDIKI